MTDQKNPQGGEKSQTFNLEEIVGNTQSAQKTNNTKPIEKSDAEIVSAMQGSKNPTKPETKKENLDTVVNPTPKKNEKKAETIDDILVEKEPKKKSNTKGGLVAAGLLLALGGGLFLLLRNGDNNPEKNMNNTGNIVAMTGTEQIITETGDTNDIDDDKKTDDSNKRKSNLGDDYSLNKEDNTIYYNNIKISTDVENFEVLGKGYAKDSKNIYYKGQTMNNVEIDKFKVIDQNGNHKLAGIIVNSQNLLEHLKERKNREFLMTTIASITNKNQNVKDELTHASVYAMDGFKGDFEELNKLQRGDKMTDLQRAKFGVIFLYVKIIKSLKTDEIRMSKAKEELRYFIKNSDKILEEYGPEKQRNTTLAGDIGYDQYCVYHNGKLFSCFLNEIFIKAKD